MITIAAMGDIDIVEGLPSFDRPPIVEVAIGVHFLQLPGLTTVALVRLVDDLWGSRYPQTFEQPTLPPTMRSGSMMAFELQTGVPPVRLWSMTADESLLVQVQHDRLLLNWRRGDGDQPYPRYRQLREDFEQIWREFGEYLGRHDYGALQPEVAEVGFFNRIPMVSVDEIPDVIAAANPEWSISGQIATAYQLERIVDHQELSGRQNIALNFRAEYGHTQLEISTRIDVDAVAEVLGALDVAHQVGVLTFDALTTENAHSMWGRHDGTNH